MIAAPPASRLRGWSLRLAGICAAISLLDLVLGWGLGIDFLVRLRPGYPAMVPATALCLLAGSIGAVLRAGDRSPRGVAACGLAIPPLVLAGHVAPALDMHPDMLSAATAAGCLAVAASLLARVDRPRGARLALNVQTVGMCVTAVPLLGYAFGAPALFANPLYTGMALHTAVSLAVLLIALLLLTPGTGWMAVVTAPERGSQMLRRLLPVLVLGPVALTGLALEASRRDLLAPDLRAAVLTCAMIGVSVAAATYFAHLANLSERRAAEAERRRQAAELAMERGQRVESLGRLVGGVAHDFNNTLAVILGNLELLQSDPDRTAHDGYISDAQNAAGQAAQLTRQLLAYGRKSRLEPVPVVLDRLLPETLRMFERLCPANVVLERGFAAPGAVAALDPSGVQQALLNLLINARDAQPGGGEIAVATRLQELGEEQLALFSQPERLWPGRFVTVTVTDHGPGMDAPTMALATEPFFTTKPVGEGTGLGLSVAAGFCRQSGGGLALSRAESGGLAVTMVFPVIPAAAAQGAAPLPAPGARPGPHRPRRILLVDDDLQVEKVMARQLRLDGHEVQIRHDAAAALRLLEEGYRPDLVITDLAMPGQMQGRALAAAIRERLPELPVVLMSGYGPPARATGEPAEIFLQKPVAWPVLRELVVTLLPGEETGRLGGSAQS
ncbi:response regulator [Mangrovicoccus algicola]|uniref:histidine kinase n=1 Tax=Mangrovicoccus algicola TaxID=2771008 RepID=A0A8J7D0S3_9RHOB|nr:response regulator [Mangrovicoccus algicola]MBE3639883.1 response regulator [Mangrovicoccus algicola]